MRTVRVMVFKLKMFRSHLIFQMSFPKIINRRFQRNFHAMENFFECHQLCSYFSQQYSAS